MSNAMMDAALEYAAKGWHVFPCRPGAKAPCTEHGIKDATTDAGTIRAWFTRWPTANLALACGPESGVFVVDVDVDEEKNVNGWATVKEMGILLNDTVVAETPRGGAHFLFKTDTPPRNKNSFKHGIDIRSAGYYIMLAPSVHPNGKVYRWREGHAPGEIPLGDFPDAYRPPTEKALPPWEKCKKIEPVARPTETGQGTPVIDRARLYLQECEPAVQGNAGHDSLLWAARSLVVGFELPVQTAISLLWSDFNPRCVPPWNSSLPSEVKDFERKVTEAERTPGTKPRGWLLDECGLRGHDEAHLAYGLKLAAGLLASAPEEAPAAAPAPVTIVKAKPKGEDMPDWILNPPGMVGDLAAWIRSTAGCPQPLLALGASLTACGALFGRKIRDDSNGRSNIYMMGVAHSSAGKDHPGDCIERLLNAAGAAMILGGSRVTSDTAIEVALQVCPTQLFLWDELGHFFASIKQAGTGSGGGMHLRTIVPTLMQLYSSPHKLYIGKQKADGELRRIDQPHVCVWGLTSPDVLFKGLSTAELRDGWLGRVITLISDDRPRYSFTKFSPPPDSLVQMTQAWVSRAIQAPDGMGNIAAATTSHQIVIPTSAEALAVFEGYRDEFYDRMILCDKKGEDTQYLWGKALQNARRVALTLAAGDRFDGAEIGEYHARYGCEFIRWNVQKFGEAVQGNIADNVFESDKQHIVKLLAKAKNIGMSKSELTKMTPTFRDRKTRDCYIADLVEAGTVVFGQHPAHPEARSGWLWKAPHGLDVVRNKKETE